MERDDEFIDGGFFSEELVRTCEIFSVRTSMRELFFLNHQVKTVPFSFMSFMIQNQFIHLQLIL